MGRKRRIKDLVEFPSADAARMFRLCLGKVTTLCKIYSDDEGNRVIAFRPKDFPSFRFVLENHGLGNCPVSKGVLKLIEHNPAEYLRFTHFN
jgi:hypothetical protein